jgi:hypothetical protein
MEIPSAELWDRLELLLGDNASLLPPRPDGRRYPHSARFHLDEVIDLVDPICAPADTVVVQKMVEGLKSFAKNVLADKGMDDSRVDSSLVLPVFSATFEYRDGAGDVRSMPITFTANDKFDAVAGVIRFWIGRQFIPEFFKELYSVKIYNESIGPISERGHLYNGSRLPFFEWKIDGAGMPFETFAIREVIAWLRHQRRK